MATHPAPPTVAERLEHIARDIHDMAFDFMEPARSHRDAEVRIARVEDLAQALRAAVRGGRVTDCHGLGHTGCGLCDRCRGEPRA